jgi:transposase
MSIIRSRQELEHLMISLYVKGEKIRALSRRFGMSRNTVRRILRAHKARRDKGHDILGIDGKSPRPSKLDPFVPKIEELFKEYPNITGQRIYEEITAAGFTGGISFFRERLRTLRPQPKKDPVVRFETPPGLQGQMDWSPYQITFRRTGKMKVQCFSYVLGFSRRQFVDFTLRRDFFTLIRRHQAAFRHFDGVPGQCLYDSEKTVVLRWEGGKPILQLPFVAFITHYECRPIICSRARPETKGKVEAPFQYVEKNLLGGRTPDDLEDLRGIARWWMANRSDPHEHRTTRRPPLELFLEAEQEALQPLPAHEYDSAEVAYRVCHDDGFVEFETNRYSVPDEYLADILALKATEDEVYVYSPELVRIAHHERLPAGERKTVEEPTHRRSRKIRYGLEPVRDAFLRLGEGAEDFLRGMEGQRNAGYHARVILRLKETYHCDDIHRALLHALRYRAFESMAVERIVKARAKPRTLESIRNKKAAKELRQALPQITQRPLEEYAALFDEKGDDDEPDRQDHEASENPETDDHGEDS